MAAQFLLPFEILDRAFVFFRRSLVIERAEISSFSRLRIFPPRIEPILAELQFSNHAEVISNYSPWSAPCRLSVPRPAVGWSTCLGSDGFFLGPWGILAEGPKISFRIADGERLS